MITTQHLFRFGSAVLLLCILFLVHNLLSNRARGREEFPEAGPHDFLRGDANDDGSINIGDGLFILNYLFSDGETPVCLAAADTDDDGRVVIGDAISLLNYLFAGGRDPAAPFPEVDIDPTPDLGCREPPLPPLPEVGSLGGPDREMNTEEAISWRRGRQLFDDFVPVSEGLGPLFNGDSCRGCHLVPVVGGAGGVDLDVVRFARVDGGIVTQLDGGPAASRQTILDVERDECHVDANVIETRQTPTVLGLGLVDRITDETLLANADPNDQNGDGISGIARMVNGRVGRFGHKSGVPTLLDFTVDALLNELGITVDPVHSTFAGGGIDNDAVADPEFEDQEVLDLAFFIAHLAPPPRQIPDNATLQQRIAEGETTFVEIGCSDCHIPSLDGPDGPVRAYSDFLLHDVGDPARYHVNEPGIDPREFRTAPLWGVRDTPPYLHDGSAETLVQAVSRGHHGEAAAASQRFLNLSASDRSKVVEFLNSL